MALILSLETSTSVCSVALHENGKLRVLSELHMEQAHASSLAVLIDGIKKITGVEWAQLKAVSVSSGPGSYTGLRIGTSTVKGLCFALGLPLISVGSLDVMAHKVKGFNIASALLCPMIDARRMEVYCKLLDQDFSEVQPVESKIIDENSFAEFLAEKEIWFLGNGAQKCEGVIKHAKAKFIGNIYPSAAELGHLAFDKYQKNEFEDVIHFEPFYLKEFLIKKPAKIESIS